MAHDGKNHGLRTPRDEIAFPARPKIQSQSQISRYGSSIFCLPHRPNFSDIFDLCLHWVSVVRGWSENNIFYSIPNNCLSTFRLAVLGNWIQILPLSPLPHSRLWIANQFFWALRLLTNVHMSSFEGKHDQIKVFPPPDK